METVEIGRLPLDVPMNYEFHFKNVGDAALEISRARTKALAGC